MNADLPGGAHFMAATTDRKLGFFGAAPVARQPGALRNVNPTYG